MAIGVKRKKSQIIVSGTKHLLKDLFFQISYPHKEIKEIGKEVLQKIKGGGSGENH